ncbi:MAG: diguanylate cyclase, partial [Betaproteobacteria bacterium]|nr:diguanylate cyclase [Betaproteobacteria bacterium]
GAVQGQVRMLRRDGETFEAEVSSTLFESMEGALLDSTVFRDITEREALQRALTEQSELFSNLAQHVPGMLYQYQIQPDGKAFFPFSSEGIQRIYAASPEDVRHDTGIVRQRVLPEDLDGVMQSIRESADTLQRWEHEYRVALPSVGVRWLRGEAQPQLRADGSVLWHGYIQDITERRQAEDRTAYLAYFDALTGLPNRSLLMDRLGMAIARTAGSGISGAVLFIDLDRFKQINDARGHSQGDKVLVQVARRLSSKTRASDTVARLGGDEFVMLLGELSQSPEVAASQALGTAEQLLALLGAPIQVEGTGYVVSASIGIAVFAEAAPGVDEVLRRADIAMYR